MKYLIIITIALLTSACNDNQLSCLDAHPEELYVGNYIYKLPDEAQEQFYEAEYIEYFNSSGQCVREYKIYGWMDNLKYICQSYEIKTKCSTGEFIEIN